MTSKTRKYLIDLVERVAWTCAQAAVGVVAVETADLPTAYAIPIATALAAVKGVIARHVGSDNTAALLPAGPDTDQG